MAGGQRDIEDAVETGVEPAEELSAGGGFAGAGLAGEQTDAAQLEEVLQSGVGFGAGGVTEQFIGLEVIVEGEAVEGEVFEVHQRFSFSGSLSFRRARPVGGDAGGVSGCKDKEGRWRLTWALA